MIKHPKSRAERLRIKRLKYEEEDKSGQVRTKRVSKERLKEQETEDELRNALRNNIG